MPTFTQIKKAFTCLNAARKNIRDEGCRIPNLDVPRQKFLKPTLSVFSQNIWCSYFAGGQDRQKRLEFLASELEKRDYDLIFLQELFIFGFGRPGNCNCWSSFFNNWREMFS
jgi:hypothetical protein